MTHTDSVETTIEEILNDNRGETLYDSENANEIAADAIDNFIEAVLPKLQAHTSQQVEEAVRAERSRIYGRLTQMKSVYETMDTGSALIQLMGEDVIREKTPNHQD